MAKLACDFKPHGAGSACDNVESSVFVFSVKIGFLDFADLKNLLASDLTNLVFIRNTGAFSNTRSLLQQNSSGWRLKDEAERTVCVDRDDTGLNHACLILSLGIEFFTEPHNVNSLRTECRTDRRCGICSASWQL